MITLFLTHPFTLFQAALIVYISHIRSHLYVLLVVVFSHIYSYYKENRVKRSQIWDCGLEEMGSGWRYLPPNFNN